MPTYGLYLSTLVHEFIGIYVRKLSKNIKDYDFYMEDNILIIDRDNPKIQEDFFTKPYTPLAQKVYEKYSLRSWIQFVFDCK